MASQNPCNSSIEKVCNFNWCTKELGNYHFEKEMRPFFFNYKADTESEILNWTNKHEQFLTNAVEVCVDEIFGTPSYYPAWFLKFRITNDAKKMREEAQNALRYKIIYKKNNSFFNNNYQITDSLFTQPFSRNDIFSNDLYNKSNLKITSDTIFFLQVGNQYNLKTLLIDSVGHSQDLTSNLTGTFYSLDVDTTIATISSNGVLQIKSTTAAIKNERIPIYVFAQNGAHSGIGQFAIYDLDNDNDFLTNSYEKKVGLNPNIKNDFFSDVDDDGLTDLFEALISSNPTSQDTDNDSFTDIQEYKRQSNLSDRNSFPFSIYSVSSGNWDNPEVWSCNCTPTILDDLIINEGHNVTLFSGQTANCNTILVQSGAVFDSQKGSKINILNQRGY